MTARIPIPEDIQHRVLDRSRRRCALCVHFDDDWRQKQGQLAHLDRDPANFAEDNLAFFCLPHHDDYDTKRRQTKSLTIREAKTARDRLYAFIETGGDLATAGQQTMRRPTLEAKRQIIKYIPHMTPKEKEIIAYLLAHNQTTFTAEADGGHAATLLSRGIVTLVAAPGQHIDVRHVPMMIPPPVWDALVKHKHEFPYKPPEDDEPEGHPWRVHWMER